MRFILILIATPSSVSKRAYFTSPNDPSIRGSMGPVAVWDGDNSLSGTGGSGSSYLLSTSVVCARVYA